MCSFIWVFPEKCEKEKEEKSIHPRRGDQRNECTQVSLVNLGSFAETQSTQRQLYYWKAHPTIVMIHEPTGAYCPTYRQLQGASSSLTIADCLYYHAEGPFVSLVHFLSLLSFMKILPLSGCRGNHYTAASFHGIVLSWKEVASQGSHV